MNCASKNWILARDFSSSFEMAKMTQAPKRTIYIYGFSFSIIGLFY